jgi:Phage gp6-like head-tail connector protein
MSLVSLEAFKEAITVADTVDDADLQRALDAASDWIENYCGRDFGDLSNGLEDRTFVAGSYDRLTIPDVASVSQVLVDSTGNGAFASEVAAGSYDLYPFNVGQPGVVGNYTEIRVRSTSAVFFMPGNQVRVTGIWGFGSTPAAVEQACILLASRYFHRLNAPFGVLESAQLGSFGSIPEQDPDVIALLAPYGGASGSAVGSSGSTWVAV